MVDLARAEPALQVSPERFDGHLYLLNVANGTLDLESGQLREHRREDLMTKLIPYPYNPDATCPDWEQFLDVVFAGDRDLIRYVQKAIGYTLTGSIGEQCFFLLYGQGKNGKSTLLDTVRTLLGDYGVTAPPSTFLQKESGAASNDIARLVGERMITAVEPTQGAKLNESVLKQLTGDGKTSARFLYGEYFEFTPTGKIWIGANDKPRVRGTDLGIWRRVHLIPFEVQIPPERRIKDFHRKLLAQEGAGILTWAVEGCRKWLTEGLEPPSAVTDATKEYRADNDPIGRFLDDCCILDTKATTSSRELYEAFSMV
jgi:putative DNA primase/helicase